MNSDPENPPADWYVDPHGRAQKRYWTGTIWSDWIFDGDEPFLEVAETGRRSASLVEQSAPPEKSPIEKPDEPDDVSVEQPDEQDDVSVEEHELEPVAAGRVRFAPIPVDNNQRGRVPRNLAETAPVLRSEEADADREFWPVTMRPLGTERNDRRRRGVLIAVVLAIAVTVGAAVQVLLRSDSPGATSPPEATVVSPASVSPDSVVPASTVPASTSAPQSEVETSVPAQPLATRTTTPKPAMSEQSFDGNASRELLDQLTIDEWDAPVRMDRSVYNPNGWADLDNDCQSARDEVLIAQSLEPAVLSLDGCSVVAGRWRDPWTGEDLPTPDDAFVDHIVPLGLAHWAGAASWDDDTKAFFGSDPSAMVVVSESYKNERVTDDPDPWRPPLEEAWCGYASNWVQVKSEWEMWVTPGEYEALADMLATC